MSKKSLKLIGTILAFIYCFPISLLYNKIPCFLTSVFSPISDNILGYIKVLFGSIILSGVTQKIRVITKKTKINNICFSNFIGAFSSMPIFLMIYLPIYFIIGKNIVVTIIIMFIAIILAELISYMIMNKKDLQLENTTIIFVFMVYIIFTILTYSF